KRPNRSRHRRLSPLRSAWLRLLRARVSMRQSSSPRTPAGKIARCRQTRCMMFMPTHSLPGLEPLLHLVLRLYRAQRDLKPTRQKRRAVVVRQCERLLLSQRKFAARGVVGDISARGLVAQPLAHIAFRRARSLRELTRRLRSAGRQTLVQSELVADRYQRGVKRRPEVRHSFPQEFVQLLFIDWHSPSPKGSSLKS